MSKQLPVAEPTTPGRLLPWLAFMGGMVVVLACGGTGIGLTVWLMDRPKPPPSEASPSPTSQPQSPVSAPTPRPGPVSIKPLRERGGNSGEHVTREFAEALSGNNLDAAYACTSGGFQQRQSAEQFKQALGANKVLEGPLPFQYEGVGQATPWETTFHLRYRGTRFGSPPAAVLHVIRDSQGWWIDTIEWNSEAAGR